MQESTGRSGSGFGREEKKKEKLEFEDESIPLYNRHAAGTYNWSPLDIFLQHTDVAEEYMYFWRMGTTQEEAHIN